MKLICLVRFLLSMFAASGIQNPVDDFIEFNPAFEGRVIDVNEIEVFKLDITGDAIPEIFIRNTEMPGDGAGVEWVLYWHNGDEFDRIGVPVKFHSYERIGRFKGVEGTNLVSYHPGGGSSGSLSAILLVDGQIEYKLIRRVNLKESSADREWQASVYEPLELRSWTIKVSELDQYDMTEILSLTPDRLLSEVENATNEQGSTNPPEPASETEEVEIEAPEEAALTQTASVQEPADIQPQVVDTTTEIVQQPESGTSEPLAPSRNYVPYIVVGLILLAGVAAIAYKAARRN